LRIEKLLIRLGLPTKFNQYKAEDVLAVMLMDKKKEQGKLRFVLPSALGSVVVRGDVAREDVMAVLQCP
jgi:3-dehydroquinate synthase